MSPWLARAEAPVRRVLRPALWLLVIVPAIVLVAQLLLDQLGAEPIEALEHASGEWALRLLAASLAVTPLMRLTGWGWMVAQRRFLGLAAFFWAMGHLSVYLVLDQFFDWPAIAEDILKRLYITVGMLAFLLLVPLALTSTKSSIRKLGGKRWNQLHRLVYVSAVAGCVHFLWAVKKDLTAPLLYAGVFALLFVLRVVWRGSPRRA
ncbi:MAG: sulfoxide reductase heme-binding subunit YedZ [Gemmatimonadota bacterium]|nr:sulfoxide reductase heme-binding subunit YedZ [Gemmatimonadota bacterium]MDQ8167074.1 sulfoxide reductase heme-binding subunit YedZ [Gemmatimonadota bacterium]MDQ8171125.1 sulfoxide reductase heme-binding subunit YedZ [Gemmatimonadota bacterium]